MSSTTVTAAVATPGTVSRPYIAFNSIYIGSRYCDRDLGVRDRYANGGGFGYYNTVYRNTGWDRRLPDIAMATATAIAAATATTARAIVPQPTATSSNGSEAPAVEIVGWRGPARWRWARQWR
jgi:hypothetical protein